MVKFTKLIKTANPTHLALLGLGVVGTTIGLAVYNRRGEKKKVVQVDIAPKPEEIVAP